MIFYIFWSIVEISANEIKVFGTDSYHSSRIFEQKYSSYRTKNKRPVYDAVTSKYIENVENERKPQIGTELEILDKNENLFKNRDLA